MPTNPAPPPIPTLANWRDITRRWLEIVPGPDLPTPLSAGALPPGQPNPDNPTLNQAINSAIDLINQVVCCGSVTDLGGINVSAAPAYKRGFQYIDFSGQLGPIGTSLVNVQIVDVLWQDASQNFTRLQPYTFYTDDVGQPAKYRPFQQLLQAPVPESYIILGNQIGLTPPVNQGGVLYLTILPALPQLTLDTDAIETLPYPYLDLIGYLSVILVGARTIRDVDQSTRAGQFLPLATQGLTNLYNWKGGSDPGGLNRVLDTLRMITSGGLSRLSQGNQGANNASQSS